jgi:hypothetical protein
MITQKRVNFDRYMMVCHHFIGKRIAVDIAIGHKGKRLSLPRKVKAIKLLKSKPRLPNLFRP